MPFALLGQGFGLSAHTRPAAKVALGRGSADVVDDELVTRLPAGSPPCWHPSCRAR